MKSAIALLVVAFATPVFADTFICGNDTDTPNARWHARISHATDRDAGRVPGFLLIHNAKEKGSIVSTDDRRRIKLGAKREVGTSYNVKLNAEEKKKLVKLADGRVNVKDAVRASVWVDFELNEEQHEGQLSVPGRISFENEDAEVIYEADLSCSYKE